MAKIMRDRRCLMCGNSPVQLWTIDNLSKVTVSYLCDDHGGMLQAIMDAAGDWPPDQQQPLPDRVAIKEDDLPKNRIVMEPLLDWTPPEEKVPDEVAIVRKARAEGKSWREIGDALGMSKQEAFEKYATLQDEEPKVSG